MKNQTNKKRSPGVSRREILQGTSALAAAGVVGSVTQASLETGARSNATHDVLVQVFLRGAMDGLTTVVPHADGDYYAARPTLAVPPPGQAGGAVNLDGFFGLAPSAAPLMTPYANGHLAFVHACGSTDPTRSHFEAFRRMEFGEPGLPTGTVSNGWLARYLIRKSAGATGLLRAVQQDYILPLSLAGAPSTLPIPNLGNFLFPGDPLTAQERADLMKQAYQRQAAPVGPAALNTFDSIDLMATIDFANYVPAGGAQYPNSEFGRRLRDAAALIKAGRGVEAITIDYHSWDLHANLGPLDGAMAIMLDDLTRAIEAFYLDMLGLINKVTFVCVSEFGRRVAENSSAGVDHGHGNAMMIMGGGVAGGQVIANWPGLAAGQLDDGDLAVTTDYRDVYGEILARRLGATPSDLAAIFPMHTFAPVGAVL